jgi:hypothetical protein
MADFYIGQDARRPTIVVNLLDAQGYVNLTGASSTTFRMRLQDGTTAISGTATVSQASTGEVTYAWGASDTATPGEYIAEWSVTWSTGITQTFPTDRVFTVLVRDKAT